MFTISNIRKKARKALNETPGMYQLAVIPVVISVIVQFISLARSNLAGLTTEELTSPSYLFSSSLFPLFYGLLLGLLYLSIGFTMFRIIKGTKKTTSFRDALSIFSHKDFGKVLSTFILKSFFLFLWGLLLHIGMMITVGTGLLLATLAIAAGSSHPDVVPQDVLMTTLSVFAIGLACMILGALLYIPKLYAYSQVEYILFDQLQHGKYSGAFSIIKSSKKLMKGYKFKRFMLDVSFLGWFILVNITFGLAGLYVWPYQYAAQVYFYEELVKEQSKKVHHTNE